MDLLILTTGGSMDKTYSTSESAFIVGEPRAGRILTDAGVTLEVEVRCLMRRDSLEITDDDREMIVCEIEGSGCRAVVVTHGTDSMIETGLFLERIRDRTIVLTGAMRPADFRSTDAEFNLGAAVSAASILPPGVYIAMNGRILKPSGARKNGRKDVFEEGTSG
jgi:L-asparaginase